MNTKETPQRNAASAGLRAFLRSNYRWADRIMLAIIWVLFVMSLALSSWHNTLHWALTIGLTTAVAASLAVWRASGTKLTRVFIATAMMVMAALHIHQAGGATEFHFGIFVLLAFLLCYRDWSVIVVAAGVIALHHLSFNYLQELGYGVLCLTQTGIGMVLLHAGYVIAESIVLCYLAVLLNREAVQAAELSMKASKLTAQEDGTIDLRPAIQAPLSESGRSLANALQAMQDAMLTVNHSVDTIATASSEIAAGNQDLSQRTEEQAISLQNTVESVEKLTEIVKENGENARRANDLAISASGVASKGGDVVRQVVETMSSINDSSRRVVDIIAVIDGIAFQTNILALNAAVEAARAGEQGRGFAVVAAEVRNLAQRSSAAAKEIKVLIEDSSSKVDAGSALVQQAGATMKEVVESVARVTSMMGEINASSGRQESGIEHIREAIANIDDVTQQNTALVEEAASAADSLQRQAEDLTQVIARFKIEALDATGSAALVSQAKPGNKAVRQRAKPLPGSSRKQGYDRPLLGMPA